MLEPESCKGRERKVYCFFRRTVIIYFSANIKTFDKIPQPGPQSADIFGEGAKWL